MGENSSKNNRLMKFRLFHGDQWGIPDYNNYSSAIFHEIIFEGISVAGCSVGSAFFWDREIIFKIIPQDGKVIISSFSGNW
jgi:hypothetical protein